ncbi:MAG TPA: SRPBCC family protein [Burkholderiales bacterium]|jgi:uncharacterized protein YndB with AHSA1/START domain|nr:SRPBCC family protein [Burkholderiales bacterium]
MLTDEPLQAHSRGPGTPLPAKRGTTVRVTAGFEASPEHIFDGWIDPGIAGKWLFATASRPCARVAIDARVGGAFRFVERHGGETFEHAGVYVEIDRPRRLVFTLSDGKRSRDVTRVEVGIAPHDGNGSELTLCHENVPPDRAHRVEARWTGMLYGLGVMLDL